MRLGELARHDGGAVAIEFAIVAPAFIALLIAILQTSLVYFAQQGLETTAEKAARLILTGQAQTQGLSASTFKTEVCKSLPPFMRCSSLFVDVRQAANFGAAGMAAPTLNYDQHGNSTNTAFEPGTAGSIVVIKLMYQWPALGGPLNFGLGTDSSGKHIIVATQVSKTEPY